MTRQEFDDLVRRIEARYAGRAAALRRSTTAWVVFGLAGILACLTLLFLVGAAAFVGGIVLPFQAGVWLLIAGALMIVYAIAQTVVFLGLDPAPLEGRALRPAEAPALWELLDSLRHELQCHPFDHVRVSMNFGAGIRELPRLGLFGWPRTLLDLGLPLLTVLTYDEVRAVLAHELAHHSARHARSGSRIYRLNCTWNNVIQRMQQPASGRFSVSIRSSALKFVNWYWPRLHARAMVLSRAQEFHADSVAAGIAGGPTLVSALWKLECFGPWLSERFWMDVYQDADRLPEPPADVMDRLRRAIETPPSLEDRARWMERGLSRTTGNDETHPAFRERAAALGVFEDDVRRAGFATAIRPSAAETLLGADSTAIERELAGHWQRSALGGWHARARQAVAESKRRESSQAADPARAVEHMAALWKTAREAAEIKGTAAAEPLLRDVLSRDPLHAGASVVLGHHLLNVGDAEGRRLLEQVVDQADETWMRPACEVLQEHFQVTGQTDQLREIRSRLDRHERESAAAQRERAKVLASDDFVAHELTEAQVDHLRKRLSSHPDCGAAWLVRKKLRYFPNRPLFVLCVRRKSARRWLSQPDRDREMVRRLSPTIELPGQVLVVARYGSFGGLAARIMSFAGASVFPPHSIEMPKAETATDP
jgi:hypothetical protein